MSGKSCGVWRGLDVRVEGVDVRVGGVDVHVSNAREGKSSSERYMEKRKLGV